MTPCQGFCKDELGDGLPWLGPEAKTPPSNVGVQVQPLGRKLRSRRPCGQKTKM